MCNIGGVLFMLHLWIIIVLSATQAKHLPPERRRQHARQVESASIPFAQSSGLIDSPESRTIAAAVCKAHCLKECVDKLRQKSVTDPTIGEVLRALSGVPTQLHSECSRLSPGFLYYEECEQACEADRPYTACSRMCEAGDSPSGWSCLTGCRLLDAALKERSGECPPQGGPAIHRLPGLIAESIQAGMWPDPKVHDSPSPTTDMATNHAWYPQSGTSGSTKCTMDAECPQMRDKCCQSQCKKAVFRQDILPPSPTVRILEAKSPPSFLLSWTAAGRPHAVENNITEPIVYVLQVKMYFGPDFDSRLANPWKTLVMYTLTGAQLSEPRIGWWYQFQVSAVNRFGSLGFELPSPPVRLTNQQPDPPSAPRGLTDGVVTLHADGEIRARIHWSNPAIASIPVTEYRIYWGQDDSNHNGLKDFSEKPAHFVQTVPSSETSYQLTGLLPNSLYRVQIQAMSEWGSTQLRSPPSSLFIRTPAIDRLSSHGQGLSPMENTGYPHNQDVPPVGPASQSALPTGHSASSSSAPGARESPSVDRLMDTRMLQHSGRQGLTTNSDPDQCVCDGRTRSALLPMFSSSKSNNHLTLHTDSVIFDGQDIVTRIQLTERYPLKTAAHTNDPRPLQLTWIPQVCIESHHTEPRLSRLTGSPNWLRPESEPPTPPPMSKTTIVLQPNRRRNRTEWRREGETQLTGLHLNCRYLLEARELEEGGGAHGRGQSQLALRACLCTPTCTELSLAPWVPPLDCQPKETESLPKPQDLKHHSVLTSPLSYNITWKSGYLKSISPVERRRAHNPLSESDSVFHRLVWGPSRDKPINPALWNSWSGLRPRLDPTQAETKVLRNGETSLLIGPLVPETQYVVKLQAIGSSELDTSKHSTERQNQLNDPSRVSMRSASQSDAGNQLPRLQASKEVFLYFQTPSDPDGQAKQVASSVVVHDASPASLRFPSWWYLAIVLGSHLLNSLT